jgi:hypothetical protein
MADTAHGTLTANVVTSLFVESGRGGVVIVNRDQAGTIWVRIDGADPVPEAADTYAVFGSRQFPQQRNSQETNINVRLISDTARKYTVEAY